MPSFPRRFIALLLLSLPAGAALADIYGYVDEQGVAHLSNVPLDQRYYLYKREYKETVLPGGSNNAVVIHVPAPGVSPRRTTHVNPASRKQYSALIAEVAQENKLSPALLHAVIAVESGYNPGARSPKGASGLMQLMPETARRYGVRDIWDPRENLRGGARYLSDLLGMFNNNLGLALAAYNAGEGAVIQYGNRIPPYPETRGYVPRVMQHYHLIAAGR